MLGQMINYVSAYAQGRVYVRRMFANGSEVLVTDVNGAMPAGDTITNVVWQTWDTSSVVMSEPTIDGRKASIRVKAQYPGRARIRVDLTTSAGNTISVWQTIQVMNAPFFSDVSWANGPERLEATA